MALEEAGIEEEPHAAAFEEMHRAGDLARGTMECQLKIGHGERG
jgi:hypothetical protein